MKGAGGINWKGLATGIAAGAAGGLVTGEWLLWLGMGVIFGVVLARRGTGKT